MIRVPGESALLRQAGGARRRWPRRLAAAGLIVLIILIAGYPLLHYSPGFLRAAVPSGAEGERAAGRMMSKASSLVAGLDRPGEWGEAFSETEANAWLSIDLPRHAPGLLAGGLDTPRVRFLDGRAAFSAVVSCGPLSGQLWRSSPSACGTTISSRSRSIPPASGRCPSLRAWYSGPSPGGPRTPVRRRKSASSKGGRCSSSNCRGEPGRHQGRGPSTISEAYGSLLGNWCSRERPGLSPGNSRRIE